MMIHSKTDETIILWGVSISPYVRKVMVALAEKNLAYEQRETLPKALLKAIGESISPEFNTASPLGKIPAISIGNYSIADSAVIAGYLDRKFSTGNKLYPDNAESYALALWFEHFSDTTLTTVSYQKIFLEKVVKPKVLGHQPNLELVNQAINKELPPLLDYLNQEIANREWFSGDTFSMADVAIATQLLALEMCGVTVVEQYQDLRAHFEKTIKRKSFESICSK